MRTTLGSPIRFVLAATLALCVLPLGGCALGQAKAASGNPLLGTWFESRTGAEYEFVSDTLLVVPHAQPGGGNAVTYHVLAGNRLDVVSNGAHHVSEIARLDGSNLVLADPLTGGEQVFCREATRTAFTHAVEQGALTHVRAMATLAADPAVVWVAQKPTGKLSAWTAWSPSTLDAYGTAWDWATIQKSRADAAAAGGGDAIAYSFTFRRVVPAPDALSTDPTSGSVEITAGAPRIDVGYSASMAPYAAGTLVYLPRGLVYSLGDGYAIGVGVDAKGKAFFPLTHK